MDSLSNENLISVNGRLSDKSFFLNIENQELLKLVELNDSLLDEKIVNLEATLKELISIQFVLNRLYFSSVTPLT